MAVQQQRVLFLCTHNSARSQMAEGLLRALGGERFEAHSAGTEATRVRPLAMAAMAELGIDIGQQTSKTLDRYLGEPFDAVITVCDQAAEACPVFAGARRRLHWSFPDPSRATGTEEEQLGVYRQVRDDIRGRIERELIEEDPAARTEPCRSWQHGNRAAAPPLPHAGEGVGVRGKPTPDAFQPRCTRG